MRYIPKPASWITAKFPSTCPGCKRPIRKGDRIQWHQSSRKAYCESCGEQHELDLAADDFDVMNNTCL